MVWRENQVKKLLKKASELPDILKGYAEAMALLNAVTCSCFRQSLIPTSRKDIESFGRAYTQIGLDITPKIHMILSHVGDLCVKNRRGHDYFSEQACELSHHEFTHIFSSVKREEGHSEYLNGVICLFAYLKFQCFQYASSTQLTLR
ncbi:unnamed protein product [Lepeophtheirus salmonis]|uniref:(salmon louse) hypothetical protein n=1 Tax=Lepeophtheirus salmonis TaxID=72036 RepID=A0A7R8GZK7_LEPSM|nr:unnamed protein product [Lepeophtheirus salmonis]CAF2754409.1 unnamed protein product [Lepeophtheirus salmonis]